MRSERETLYAKKCSREGEKKRRSGQQEGKEQVCGIVQSEGDS